MNQTSTKDRWTVKKQSVDIDEDEEEWGYEFEGKLRDEFKATDGAAKSQHATSADCEGLVIFPSKKPSGPGAIPPNISATVLATVRLRLETRFRQQIRHRQQTRHRQRAACSDK